MGRARRILAGVATAAACLGSAGQAVAFDAGAEAQNYAKISERAATYSSPQGQLLLRQISFQNGGAALAAQVNDPERNFADDLCWTGFDGCAGDPRLYDWQARDYGIVRAVLFTARDGATLSGHVWATRAGPARRPGIVITNGSVQADEQMYWYAAQALAKAGYVVLTWDPQGQGQSDTFGESPDAQEGFPAQSDGRPFFDGTEDAINFFVSTPANPYRPIKSCTTGTSHVAKQARRVRSGLNAAYNPFWQSVDPDRLGLAGHSYGAAGVSYIGQWDPRIKAVVGWDNLQGAGPRAGAAGEQPCPSDPSARTVVPITKPGLGMSADYFITPTPYSADPPRLDKSTGSLTYSRAGVDTGELILRGGTHLDFSFIPNPAFGATLRGADAIAWYTTAWFDKYVKGDPTADTRLLTDRWRHDGPEAAVDPGHDANDFSFYYGSRLAIHRAGGGTFTCEDLRAGCPGLTAQDGWSGDYSYLALATSPDGPGPTPAGGGVYGTASRTACASGRAVVVRIRAPRGTRITAVRAYRGKRSAGRSRGPRITIRLGSRRTTVRLVVTLRRGARVWSLTLRRRFVACGHRTPLVHAARVARARSCGRIVADGKPYLVWVARGTVGCRTARRLLRDFIALRTLQPAGWACFRGHSHERWAAACGRPAGGRRYSDIVRAY